METLTTKGIRISVETKYQEEYSKPLSNKFLYTYRITIENHSERTVQLLRRKWVITDSNGGVQVVEGEGVVGEQPILKPGDSHRYVSWCPLPVPIGKMTGSFYMVDQMTGEEIEVYIPEFKLIADFVDN